MERQPADKRELLGKYELLERLGKGGMGEVWKARDTQLQRYVAIKLLHADLQDDPDFVAYFKREARLVAALRHPNIVQIHDFQVAERRGERSQAYMVMDYIEGGTLAGAIRGSVRQGKFWPASEIVDLFTSISLALDYAHGQGMIHRDIKPENILLDHSLSATHTLGVPILTDFGIARWQGGSSTLTGFVGTPLYISPEQAESRPINERSDLYALGIILYEVLTGTTPFHGDNPLAIMLQHVNEPPPAPSRLNPLVSPALSAVVLQSIAKDPRERYPSATAMTIALARAFNLPVPALLGRHGDLAGPSAFNPLQPTQGIGSVASTFVSSDPRAFSPVREGNSMTPTASDHVRQTPVSQRQLQQTPTGQYSQPGAFQTTRAIEAPARSRRRLLLVSLLCVGALLLGLGAVLVAPRLFSRQNSTPPVAQSEVVGQLRFLSNAPAAAGTFNAVQLDLNNVQSPPGGQVYYAWLEQVNSEAPTLPHWQLQVSNGGIHDRYTSPSPQTDLLAGSNRFLITSEDATSSLVVPNFDFAHRYYYALITHASTSSPTFEVRSCPTSNVNNSSNPCR